MTIIKVGNDIEVAGAVLPAKEFKSGKKGWFKQGSAVLDDGTTVRFNFMVYKHDKKPKQEK